MENLYTVIYITTPKQAEPIAKKLYDGKFMNMCIVNPNVEPLNQHSINTTIIIGPNKQVDNIAFWF